MRGKWLLLGGVAIFAAIAAGALTWWRGQQQTARASQKQDPAPASQTEPANLNEFAADGKILPVHVVAVKASLDGVIEELFAEVGSEVYEGQILARIRSGKLDAALEAATAEVEKIKTRVSNLEGSIIAARLETSRADADFERAKETFEKADKAYQRQQLLYREGATPRLTFEKAEKEFQQAKADAGALVDVAKAAAERVEALQKELDLAKKQLDDKDDELETAKNQVAAGEVAAPAEGVVTTRRGAPGETVNPTMTDFFQIAVKLTELQVALDPPPPVLERIKAGQPALLRIAEATEEIPGKVREVKGSQAFVEFVSPNPALIKPGLTAHVRVQLN